MRRSTFFLILVALGLVFALAFLVFPDRVATLSGGAPDPAISVPLRALGVMLLALSLLNFLVRNHPDSPTLASVLWTNLAVHALSPLVDFLGVAQGLAPPASILPGTAMHLALAWGCWRFARSVTA